MSQRTRTAKPTGTDASIAAPKGNQEAKRVLERMILKTLPKVSDFPDRKAKLHYVADMIEAEALVAKGIGFNMGTYRSDIEQEDIENDYRTDSEEDMMGKSCGTVACIAGWTMLLQKGSNYKNEGEFQRSGDPYDTKSAFHVEATEILELTDRESDQLFLGTGASVFLEDLTPAQAVAVIRDFADNGEVRWNHFDENGKPLA